MAMAVPPQIVVPTERRVESPDGSLNIRPSA